MSISISTPNINWNSETEVCLFYAMRGQKPVGINKHFHMMYIHKKFCDALGQFIPSEQLWQHIGTMYNLKALDESVSSPFKNNKAEFKLPPEIFTYKKGLSKPEETITEGEVNNKTNNTKGNRKRLRQSAANTTSPVVPTVKRRRQ